MKTKLFTIVLALGTALGAMSQIPQGFNYQAIARDVNGDPIAGATLQVKIGILSDTLTPVVVWEELHDPVKTNAFGLFTIVVGSGVKQSGSAATFADINWAVTPLFIKTQVYHNSIWKYLGSSKIWSVPYAMRTRDSEQWLTNGANIYRSAGNVGVGTSSPAGRLVVAPTPSWDDNIPLFEVKNKYGFPVLAVYNNGIRILVEDLAGKGVKGGFAIGGFDPAKAGETVNLMMVSADSIRLNIDNNPAKGNKGGFAIGSFDNAKAVDSRSFVNLTPQSSAKGQYNTYLGYQSGKANSTGYRNTFLGYQAGLLNTVGYKNVFIGDQSGSNNTGGHSNVFLGTGSGYSNKTGILNVFIGNNSGYQNLDGERNVFLGWNSGYSNTSGLQNVFIGESAGRTNGGGSGNVFLGYISGYSNTGGGQNVFIGYNSGYYNTGGGNNVFIGLSSGENNTVGSNNVFIGRSSGSSNINGTNNIAIGYLADVPNGATGNQIKLGNSSITYFGVQVAMTVSSDIKWKEQIRELPYGLDFVEGLKPVDYIRKNNRTGEREAGFIAQDVERLLIDSGMDNSGLLTKGHDGSLELRYNDFIPILTKAIQDQQKIIEASNLENQKLRAELELLKERLAAIESVVGNK